MRKQLRESVLLAIAVLALMYSENSIAMAPQPPPDLNAQAPIDNGCRVTVHHTNQTADAPISRKTGLTRIECNAINNTEGGIAYARVERGNVASQYLAYAQLTGRVDSRGFPHEPISGLSAQELINMGESLPDNTSFLQSTGYRARGTWFINGQAQPDGVSPAIIAPAPAPAPVVVAAPAPTPAPVYVAPQPVYVAPQPVYVAPAPAYVPPPTTTQYPVYSGGTYRSLDQER